MKFKHIIFAAMATVLAVSCSNSASTNDTDANEASNDSTTVVDEKSAADNTADATTQTATQGEVNQLTDDSYLRVGKSYDKVIFADFNATWCVPCKKFAPVFDSIAHVTPEAEFVSVDIDKCPETAAAFNVNSVPTIIILGKDGKIKGSYIGTEDLLPGEKFDKIVKSNL